MQDIKYLREFFGLDEELLAKLVGLDVEKYLQIENNLIDFDISYIGLITPLFLLTNKEIYNRYTPLVPKVLPYSLRNLSYDKLVKTYEISTTIMLYERLISKYKQFAEEFREEWYFYPTKVEAIFYGTFKPFYKDGKINLFEVIPTFRNYTLLVKDMEDICNGFGYNLHEHYLLAVNSRLTKAQANYELANQIVRTVLFQEGNNNLRGFLDTDTSKNVQKFIATRLLVNVDDFDFRVKKYLKENSLTMVNKNKILELAEYYEVEPIVIEQSLKFSKFEFEPVTDATPTTSPTLIELGFKDYAHGEYHRLIDMLDEADYTSMTTLNKMRRYGGKF